MLPHRYEFNAVVVVIEGIGKSSGIWLESGGIGDVKLMEGFVEIMLSGLTLVDDPRAHVEVHAPVEALLDEVRLVLHMQLSEGLPASELFFLLVRHLLVGQE